MFTQECSGGRVHAHSTPDPDDVPQPKPSPVPDDVPSPVNAPVEEPRFPEPPIKAASRR